MDFTGKINKSDIDAIITKLTQLYNTYRSPNVKEEINSSYQPPSGVTVGNNITIQDLNAIHTHYKTKIGNLNNADLGMPSQYDIILDDEFEQLYSAIAQINFISQQPCYACDDYECYCDGSCHYYDPCTCDFTCDSGFYCDLHSKCYPDSCTCNMQTFTCGCDDVGFWICTVCFMLCYEESYCGCDHQCHIIDACPCNSQCDGYECQCDGSGHYDCNQCFSSNYLCTNNY